MDGWRPHLDTADDALSLILGPTLVEDHPHDNAREGDMLLHHCGQLRLKLHLGGRSYGPVLRPAVLVPAPPTSLTSPGGMSKQSLRQQTQSQPPCTTMLHVSAGECLCMLTLCNATACSRLHGDPAAGPACAGAPCVHAGPAHGGHVLPHQQAQPVSVVVPAVRLHLHSTVQLVSPIRMCLEERRQSC